MSKKSKYLWKKIMILTWMFSLFLGILAGPCAIDAKNQKEKKDYGVFLSIDSSQIKKLYRSEERRVGKECRSRWSPYH